MSYNRESEVCGKSTRFLVVGVKNVIYNIINKPNFKHNSCGLIFSVIEVNNIFFLNVI